MFLEIRELPKDLSQNEEKGTSAAMILLFVGLLNAASVSLPAGRQEFFFEKLEVVST